MPRKYTKKSPYWTAIKGGGHDSLFESTQPSIDEISSEPKFVGKAWEDQVVARTQIGGVDAPTRQNSAAFTSLIYKYANIRNGLLPYEKALEGYNIRDAIELCQKAYANVSIFRNAIDILSEFSNAEIALEGGSKKSREFIKAWFEKIRLWNIKDQYFREYYRSGNVFYYRIASKLDTEGLSKFIRNYADVGGNVKNEVPVTYILLNPFEITVNRAMAFKNGVYYKIYSEYDLERLRQPKTQHDQEVFDALDKDIQEKIKNGTWYSSGLRIKIDPEKLRYSFYKKQDYEPFAVPFAFPVLADINHKLELKKIDQSICRTIENVILLITMGNEPQKGGINHKNITAMQQLLMNESIGRVLVADYTTKAEFIIPDLNKVLGSEKYKVVNEDIKEGLQNILIGSEKFANTTIKASVFFERLKESRRQFLSDFLQPEIDQLCKNLGFRDVPKAKFEEVSLKDENEFNRVVTRMMELGILPPEEAFRVLNTGIYPTSEELDEAQKKYVKDRENGLYNPLIGGVPTIPPPLDPNGGLGNKTPAKKPSGTTGRPSKANLYSVKSLVNTIKEVDKISASIEDGIKKKYKVKKLTENQIKLVAEATEQIVMGKQNKDWVETALAFVNDFSSLDGVDKLKEVKETVETHSLEDYPAALVYHSQFFPE